MRCLKIFFLKIINFLNSKEIKVLILFFSVLVSVVDVTDFPFLGVISDEENYLQMENKQEEFFV